MPSSPSSSAVASRITTARAAPGAALALVAQIALLFGALGGIDREKRKQLYFRLQRRIYELQPYMFSYNVPIKFAMARRVRNFKQYGLNPGYRIRDWFIVE